MILAACFQHNLAIPQLRGALRGSAIGLLIRLRHDSRASDVGKSQASVGVTNTV